MQEDLSVDLANLKNALDALKYYGFSEMLRLAVLHNDRNRMVAMLVLDLVSRVRDAQKGRVVEGGNPPELQYTHTQLANGKIEKIGGNYGTNSRSS